MLDDFFIRAIVAATGVALFAAPLGCFIVWRRLAYFGDTLSHSALLGIALGLLLGLQPILAVFATSALVALALISLRKKARIASDSLLGLLAHSTLAIGLVILSYMSWLRVDLNALLFGDILSVTRTDIAIIYGAGVGITLVLMMIWRTLFATTVNRDLAEAEGMPVDRVELIFMLLLSAFIAISMKIVGALLITALLIIPAATARRLAIGPESMAIWAAIVGIVSATLGLNASWQLDTPAGPTIVVASLILFLIGLLPFKRPRKQPLEGE